MKTLPIAERFHLDTAITRENAQSKSCAQSPLSATKNNAIGKRIALPAPDFAGLALEECIRKRRSMRDFGAHPITLQQLSQLLFAAQGITAHSFTPSLRAAPSGGALYPFEIYMIINNVEGLPAGLYHFLVHAHQLAFVSAGDYKTTIVDIGLNQQMLGAASVTFILSAVFARTSVKYGERGLRYIYIEAGHISQNLLLQAVSLGLGSVAVGAFVDTEINQLIGVDGIHEAAIYLHAVGTRT